MTDSESRRFVEVDSLRYRYRSARSWALDEISFQAERGLVLGLVGPNGSGKTTLFRLILGFMLPESGRVSVGGEEPAAYRTSCGVGYLPEQVRLPGNVRVRELAVLMGRLAGLRGIELDGAIDRHMSILAIEEKADALVSSLSHGYRRARDDSCRTAICPDQADRSRCRPSPGARLSGQTASRDHAGRESCGEAGGIRQILTRAI